MKRIIGAWLGWWLAGTALAAPGLTPFSDCGMATDYLVATAVQEAELARGNGDLIRGVPLSPGVTTAIAGGATADVSGGTAVPHSTTTVQEEGVDEPDEVKSDGNYFYLVSGDQLVIAAVWPATATAELSRSTVEGSPWGLVVEGDVAAVISSVWDFSTLDFAPNTWSLTKVTLFDIADRAQPQVVRELYLEGDYLDARLTEGRLHLAIASYLSGYQPTAALRRDLFPAHGVAHGLARKAALLRYRAALKRLGVDGLLPRSYNVTPEAGGKVATIAACGDIYYPDQPNGSQTLSLVTLDLRRPTADQQVLTVVGSGGTVYASNASFYLAEGNYGAWQWLDGSQGETTTVHKIALGTVPEYRASGEVAGWLPDRYAMSEWEGVLRLVTTADQWDDDGAVTTTNALYTLAEEGGSLKPLGYLGGLGKVGERIYAARLLGPKGYLVTFRQVDPLYTIDLSDPAAPQAVGELEVPGYSTYLQPIDDDRLLAVGWNTETGGVDLSLFDVGDFAHPQLTARENLGSGSYSAALYDPHALTWLDGTLVLPVGGATTLAADDWSYSGAFVYRVDPTAGFTLLGAVDHSSHIDCSGADYYCGMPAVARTLLVGPEEGRYLYTLSAAGLRVDALAALGQEVVWLDLPGYDYGWGPIYYLTETGTGGGAMVR